MHYLEDLIECKFGANLVVTTFIDLDDLPEELQHRMEQIRKWDTEVESMFVMTISIFEH